MSSVCTIVTPGPLIDKYFAAYVIRVQAESGYPKALARGVREGGADFRRWETLAELPLPVPPLEHQRRVVAFLNYETAQINSLVEKQERLIETLAERRQAVISHAVTKGLDPTAQMKDSGVEWLGSVPESWVAAPIKWIASLTTGMTPASDDAANYSDEAEGFPWIRPEDLIESGITTTASRFVSALGWNISRIVPAGATLLCCIGATVGKVGIIDEACSTNQQITSLKSAGHDRYFFYAVLASKPELVSSATGNTMPILNSGRLGSIVLPVPPLAEQAAIAAHLDRETAQMDALAAKAREMIDVLKERRQALISAAVTGKIDVRGLS
jgi:type I restriction enzyme S subunit